MDDSFELMEPTFSYSDSETSNGETTFCEDLPVLNRGGAGAYHAMHSNPQKRANGMHIFTILDLSPT
jgi:hypothetical protein